ncbi:MAG: ATP-binding protein [Spirochaetales bacterium]|nr:ATP-binding protein [Spirochaetales bacterium]
MRTDSRIITRLFLRLLPVQILFVAISSINSVIDGIVASNIIGVHAMTAIGLFGPLMKFLETLNLVLLSGSQILCGQFLGKRQLERTENIFSLDIFLVSSIAVLISLVCLLAPTAIAAPLSGRGSDVKGLSDYIRGMSFGFLPTLLSSQLSAFLQLEQKQRRIYIGMGVMMAMNFILDIVFVRFLTMGLFGLGLSTSVSSILFLIVLGSWHFGGRSMIRFSMHRIRWTDLPSIVRIGIPGAVCSLCLAFRGLAVNHILMQCSGDAGVAAMSAMNTYGYLLYAMTAGVASATRLLVSVFYGEEDRTGLVLVMRTAIRKGVLLVVAVSCLVFAFSGILAGSFYNDQRSEVYRLTKDLFRIYSLAMPISAVCVIFSNCFQSISRMGMVHILSVVDGFFGVVLSGLVLCPFMGAYGIWWSLVLNNVYTSVIIVAHAHIRNRRFSLRIDDLIALPGSFGVPEDRRLDITIHSKEEVTDTSRLVMDFCRDQGIDRRRSYYAGLCLEEMASNIVEHGFDGKGSHSIDVRVVHKDDDLLLRIKDDCRAFNPEEKMRLLDPEDITHNIGLRMVHGLAKETFYSNVLGLNIFTMTI